MAQTRKKNPLAVALAELRWKGVSKAERSRQMTKAVQARWAKHNAARKVS